MKKVINFLTAATMFLALVLRKQHIRIGRPSVGRHGRTAAFLLLLLTVAMGVSFTAAQAQSNPTTQIGFILDGSQSINVADPNNWDTIRTGLANALADSSCVPQDGSVEFTLTVFGSGAEVVIEPTTIDDAGVANNLAATVRNLNYPNQATNIAQGLVDTADAMRGSPNFSPDLKQAVNLVTDGSPNTGSNLAGCPPVSTDRNQRWADAPPHTECARDYLVSTLEMTEDQDELDAEFIGAEGDTSNWLKDNIVYPQPGSYADLASNTFNDGWVLVVPDAAGFTSAVCTKFQQIIEPEETNTPTPEPTDTPTPEPTTTPPALPTTPIAHCSWGDVHIRTPDGLAYDFQQRGDFILAQSTSGDVMLQGRQEWSATRNGVSINKAVAMNVAGDRLELYLSPVSPERSFYINGVLTDLPTTQLRLPNGGIINPTGDDFTIVWPDGNTGARVIVVRNNHHLQIGIARLNGSLTYEGVCGNLDGNAENDMQIRGGNQISISESTPATNDQLVTFGNSWLAGSESLFHIPISAIEPDTSVSQTTPNLQLASISRLPANQSDDSEAPLTLLDLDPAKREAARQTCQNAGIEDELALATCTFDVAATDDPIFVESAQTFQTAMEALPPAERTSVAAIPSQGLLSDPDEERSFLDEALANPAGLLTNPYVLGALGALLVLFILRLFRRRR